jgi:putative tryptophan/tyrosine transport system substrate-binding protein
MQRRDVLTFIAGFLAAQSVRAQPSSPPVVGFLNSASADGYARYLSEFRAGLKQTGYVEGQNVVLLYRWAEGQYDRLPGLAADLVSRQVRVIAATSTPAAVAAKAATTIIPIVFTTAGNPVELGLVASFGRPGGNVTGANQITVEVAAKRLELLHELLPNARIMAVLMNPTGPNAVAVSNDTQGVGATLAAVTSD